MRRKLNKREVGAVVLVGISFVSILAAVYLLFFYNREAYSRQNQEEELADAYIANLLNEAVEHEGKEDETNETSEESTNQRQLIVEPGQTEGLEMDGKTRQEKTYIDDIYYERDGVTYTPDYALGSLFCVLEYPNVGIRRGVYTGTWDEIYYDLDLWMTTTSRPDYELGETHLAIYGHNHTAQNLSFNNLKNATLGDEFYLYGESGVYVYEVTDIFSEWRETTTSRYVDNTDISSDICYIITCGRDNFLINGQSSRYKDFIVQGNLVKHYSLTEYANMIIDEEEEWNE